jgi:hypothetical protein
MALDNSICGYVRPCQLRSVLLAVACFAEVPPSEGILVCLSCESGAGTPFVVTCGV